MVERSARFRLQYKFWLDINQTGDAHLADEIEELKEKRQFAKTIRDGLRLILDLRRGNTDVLCELFPLIGERLRQGHPSEVIAVLDEVKTLLGRNGNGAGQWIAPQFSMPVFDSTPEVRVIENEEERKKISIQNTLAALNDF